MHNLVYFITKEKINNEQDTSSECELCNIGYPLIKTNIYNGIKFTRKYKDIRNDFRNKRLKLK